MDDGRPALGVVGADVGRHDIVEGLGTAPLGGYDGQACRLVHGDDVVVLIKDDEAIAKWPSRSLFIKGRSLVMA
jgi:hypothetical protein